MTFHPFRIWNDGTRRTNHFPFKKYRKCFDTDKRVEMDNTGLDDDMHIARVRLAGMKRVRDKIKKKICSQLVWPRDVRIVMEHQIFDGETWRRNNP